MSHLGSIAIPRAAPARYRTDMTRIIDEKIAEATREHGRAVAKERSLRVLDRLVVWTS